MTETIDQITRGARLYAAREAVINSMPGIITAFITLAQQGSCPHAQFLVEFADGGQGNAGIDGSEESLAAMLMKELREASVA